MINKNIYRFKKLHDADSDYEYWMSRPANERFRAIEILRQRYIELFYDGSEHGVQRIYKVVRRK